MYNPKEVAKKVEEKMKEGKKFWEAVEEVSEELSLRCQDVEIASVILIEDLWEMWAPNLRRRLDDRVLGAEI